MNYLQHISLCVVWALALLFQDGAKPAAGTKDETPKPTVSVSFERQSIREDDSVNARIWLSNDGSQTLTSVKLRIAGPDFLEWHSGSCDGDAVTGDLDLGAVQPNQIINSTLCIKTRSRIVVGDFNNLFIFDYTWQKGDKGGRSFVTVEKPLKANLFGSDSIAGVPLALAGYIVPGFFFWLILSYFKFPYGIQGVALGDKLIYSVLVSLVIVLLWNRLSFPETSSGISLRQLSKYAVMGILLGAFIGGGYGLWQRIKQNREMKRKERLVKVSDGPELLLEKLLEAYPGLRRPKTTVRLHDGSEYVGSLAAQADDVTAIVGWFKIDRENVPDNLKQQFDQLYDEKKLLEIVKLANRMKVPIDINDTVFEVTGDDLNPTEYPSNTWITDHKSIIKHEAEKFDREPLILE